MTDLFPVLYLLSKVTIQSILKRYVNISWVNWLRNGELSKSFQYIWRTLYISVVLKTFLLRLEIDHNLFHKDYGGNIKEGSGECI